MEEEKDPSPEYIKDFNDGYLVAENHRDLGDMLTKVDSDNPRMSAMKAGAKTSLDEKTPARYPSWLKSSEERISNEPDKQPPSKDIEPER